MASQEMHQDHHSGEAFIVKHFIFEVVSCGNVRVAKAGYVCRWRDYHSQARLSDCGCDSF